jgi:Flp pilus assembly protein TadD
MTAIHGPDRRDVIPRWRPFGRTVRTGELSSLGAEKSPAQSFGIDLREAVRAYRTHPGIYTAGDLLGQAVLAGEVTPDVLSAATLLEQDESATEVSRQLAHWMVAGQPHDADDVDEGASIDLERMRRRVTRMRGIVRAEPRNVIRRVDLALAHLNLGAVTKAERELEVALQLAPDNRYVLRSAARLSVLRGDPERGQQLLQASEATQRDPWLLATELALAEVSGRSSRNLRRARVFLDRSGLRPWDLSELASALATTELRSGNLKKARRLMRQALIQPTENAIAQAEWASLHGVDGPDPAALTRPFSFEARALSASQVGELDNAVEHGRLWQADQPFAPEPALFTSYMASVGTEQYSISVAAARQGLVANPADALLRNNLVFALACDGRIGEAQGELAALNAVAQDCSAAATITATRGLVAFRAGDIESGRRLYGTSIEQFRARRENDVAALATVFWAREEARAKTPFAPVALRAAYEIGQQSESTEVGLWLARLAKLVRSSEEIA